MKNTNFYLLEDTQEAIEMRQNITNLIESNEENNLTLAFQLLKGGGIHDEHISYILGLAMWLFEWNDLRNEAKMLFRKWANQETKDFYNFDFLHKKNEYWHRQAEVDFYNYLTNIKQTSQINSDILATMAFILLDKGKKYLLEKEIRTDLWYKLVYGVYLDLSYLQLKKLPIQLNKLRFTQINLDKNPLEIIPDEFKNIEIEYINGDVTYIKDEARKKLELFFPEAMALAYYNKGCDEKSKLEQTFPEIQPIRNYFDCLLYFEKSVQLNKKYGEAWHNIGACYVFAGKREKGIPYLQKAFECYQTMIDDNAQNKNTEKLGHYYFWQSCACALMQNFEEGIILLKKSIEHDAAYQYYAENEEDWAEYRDNETFIKIMQ